MDKTISMEMMQDKYKALSALMDERMRRRWAAAEASSLGHGGIALVARATGLSRTTIQAGIAELRDPSAVSASSRIRRKGAGRPRLSQQDTHLLDDLQQLLAPVTRGEPQSPLLWTCKSTHNLADALVALGHPISHDTVAHLLEDMDYSLQGNCKTR